MNRKQSLLIAGFLAALITTGVVTIGSFVANAASQPAVASTNEVQTADPTAQSAVDAAYLAEVQTTLAAYLLLAL